MMKFEGRYSIQDLRRLVLLNLRARKYRIRKIMRVFNAIVVVIGLLVICYSLFWGVLVLGIVCGDFSDPNIYKLLILGIILVVLPKIVPKIEKVIDNFLIPYLIRGGLKGEDLSKIAVFFEISDDSFIRKTESRELKLEWNQFDRWVESDYDFLLCLKKRGMIGFPKHFLEQEQVDNLRKVLQTKIGESRSA